MPMESSGHPLLMALSDENLPKSRGLVPCLPQLPPTLQGLTAGSSGTEVNSDALRSWSLQDCTLTISKD